MRLEESGREWAVAWEEAHSYMDMRYVNEALGISDDFSI